MRPHHRQHKPRWTLRHPWRRVCACGFTAWPCLVKEMSERPSWARPADPAAEAVRRVA